jgi:hypothetical protein
VKIAEERDHKLTMDHEKCTTVFKFLYCTLNIIGRGGRKINQKNITASLVSPQPQIKIFSELYL